MANKTEKPTQKKLQDASKKGQILKSRDLTISVIMLVGTLYLGYVFDVHCNDPAVPAQLSGFGIGLRRCFHL